MEPPTRKGKAVKTKPRRWLIAIVLQGSEIIKVHMFFLGKTIFTFYPLLRNMLRAKWV